MADPLVALRQELQAGAPDPVAFYDAEGVGLEASFQEAKFVKIGGLIFPKDAPTAFKSKRGNGPHYTVEAVGFLFYKPQYKELAYTEYIQLARRAGVGIISLVDKKDLVAYVDSAAETPCIDSSAAPVPCFASFEDANQQTASLAAAAPVDQLSFAEPAIISTRPLRSRASMFQSSKVPPEAFGAQSHV